MSTLRIPFGVTGANVFAAADWFGGRPVLDVDRAPWEGELTVLVVGPVRAWLPASTEAAVDAWAEEVRSVVVEAPGTVRLAVSVEPVTSLEQLVTLADGRRWPPSDVADGARHAADDRIPLPAASGVAQQYAEALLGDLVPGLPYSWLTAAEATADAVASVARSLDADPGMTPEEAQALRGATRRALAAIEEVGVVVTGPRDALLWPVPDDGGRIPIDVATDAAVEVMLGQLERRVVR